MLNESCILEFRGSYSTVGILFSFLRLSDTILNTDLTLFTEKKVWVPKHAKRKIEAQAREAERKRLAQTSTCSTADQKPLYAWDDPNKEDSDSDVEVRKRQNCPETDDDWAALYGNAGDTGDTGDGCKGQESETIETNEPENV